MQSDKIENSSEVTKRTQSTRAHGLMKATGPIEFTTFPKNSTLQEMEKIGLAVAELFIKPCQNKS